MSAFLTLLLYINHPQKAHSSEMSMVSQKSPHSHLGIFIPLSSRLGSFFPTVGVGCLLVLVSGFVPSYCGC